jgi:hypothetical protein
METKERIVVNFPEGGNVAEVIIREGAAVRILDPKPPVK